MKAARSVAFGTARVIGDMAPLCAGRGDGTITALAPRLIAESQTIETLVVAATCGPRQVISMRGFRWPQRAACDGYAGISS
jgi:hypothetical protein